MLIYVPIFYLVYEYLMYFQIFHHFFTPDAGLFTLYPVSIGQKGMYQYYNQENQNG